jgi:putative two-component system response regulator
MADTQPVVLVVDDAPVNIHLLSATLKGSYRVKAATSGQKALQIAQRDPPPDIILLDVMMPEMDGYEVCKRLKQDSKTCAIPVIFLSGHIDDSERQKGLKLGAVDYLSKPADPQDLLHRIRSNL